ncbi:MAG: hypothetical protein ABSF98_21005 [Bryobacteraceae bacterium]|jgi:hypothetical protein
MGENHIVPAPSNRWILLHHHIFKNAGSTVEYVLRRCFGERFATLHGPAEDSVVTGSALASFLDANPEIAAVSSHHVRYPLPVIDGIILFDLCFFRNPLRRLWSMYRYFRTIEAAEDLPRCARTAPAPAFFDLLLADYPHLINDAQVNVLANGGVYTRPPTAQDLRVALERVRRISVLGVVELFDESAVAAEYFLRPTFPALRFEYVPQNVSTAWNGPAPASPDQLRNEIGGARYEQLERLNRLDLQLVAFAKEELLRRFEMVPGRGGRMASLRRRCEALQSAGENPSGAGA